jgi:hypothetical protein
LHVCDEDFVLQVLRMVGRNPLIVSLPFDSQITDCLHVKGCWLDPVTNLIIRYKRFVASPVYRCYRITSCSISVLEAERDHLSLTYLDSGCF